MFKKTKNLLAVLFTILFVITSINPACFAQGTATMEPSGSNDMGIIKSVHAGGNYSVLLNEDGTVVTFGRNENGELGYETEGSIGNMPAKIEELTDVKSIFPSEEFVFALKNDGTLWAWGHSKDGQFGNGSKDNQVVQTPTEIPIADVKSISGGDNHSVLAKNDGTVYTWGKNTSGQLGNGKTDPFGLTIIPSPVETDLVDARTVVAGNRVTMALKNDGTIWSCGWNLYGQLGIGSNSHSTKFAKVETLSGVEKIALGLNEGHGVALKDDGTVWTWGYNSNGQLGDGTEKNKNAPVRAGELGNIVDIDAGLYHTVALEDDGTVWTWGKNEHGQLGNGSNEDSYVPVKVEGLTNIISVAAGENHTIALGDDGTVWTWGNNEYGQLGDGTDGRSEKKNIPVMIIEPGQTDDTEPPIWDDNAKIKTDQADKVNGKDVTISWSKDDVTDNVGVTGFKIYKDGELVEEVGSDITTYTIDTLEKDTEYTFRVEAVDGADNESTNGPEVTVKTRADVFIEFSDDFWGWISNQYRLRTLLELDMDESWPPTVHDAPRVRRMYSALNKKGTKSWYSVEGIKLSYFLDELKETMEDNWEDWPEYYKLNIYEIGGSIVDPVFTLTKSDIEAERYCILSDGEKIPVEPIIAYKEIKSGEAGPDFENMVDCNYKLFIGQKDENDANNSLFISRIAEIGIEECEPEPEIDKTALQDKVDEVKGYKEEEYTADSWAAFAEALADAQSVLGDGKATQGEIDNALNALNEAIENLVHKDTPTQKYELIVEDSDDYEVRETEVGLMLTLKQGISGFRHFEAMVKAIEEKLGQLEVVFTHLRNNVQQSLNSIQADSDADKIDAGAGFNIKPGDVIRIYLVDELTNEIDRNPIIFK